MNRDDRKYSLSEVEDALVAIDFLDKIEAWQKAGCSGDGALHFRAAVAIDLIKNLTGEEDGRLCMDRDNQ